MTPQQFKEWAAAIREAMQGFKTYFVVGIGLALLALNWAGALVVPEKVMDAAILAAIAFLKAGQSRDNNI